MRFGWALVILLVAAPAYAQDADAEADADAGADAGADADADADADAGADADADDEPPALPPPTLEDPGLPTEPLPEEPEEEEEEEDGQTQLLLHIGDRPPPDPPPNRGSVTGGPTDVPFVVPDDQRMGGGISAAERRPEDDPLEPPLFEIGAGAGFARLLLDMPRDYLWLSQRFEMRFEDLPALRVGLGVAEGWRDDGILFEIGPRVGYGVYIFDDRDALVEAVIWVQPGYIGGQVVGDAFSLAAGLEARLQLVRLFEISVDGGYSLIGTTSLLRVGGSIAITF